MANTNLTGTVTNVVHTLTMDQVILNPNDPRLDEAVDNSLKASIKKDGQLEFGIIRKLPTGNYKAISGNRRLKAMLDLQAEENVKELKEGVARKTYTFSAREFVGNDEQEIRLVAISNEYRKGWSLPQKVAQIEKMQALQMSPGDIASALGMSNSAEIYALIKLSTNDSAPEIYEAVRLDIIKPTTALKIAAAPDTKDQLEKLKALHTQEVKVAKAAAASGKPVKPGKPKVTAAQLSGIVKVDSRFNSADLSTIANNQGTPEILRQWILAVTFSDADSIAAMSERVFIQELGLFNFKSESAAEKALRNQLSESASVESDEDFDDSGLDNAIAADNS